VLQEAKSKASATTKNADGNPVSKTVVEEEKPESKGLLPSPLQTIQPKSSSSLKTSSGKSGQTAAAAAASPTSLAVLLQPLRLCKLTLVAWLLAEVLDHMGILHEDTPTVLRSQFHRVWYDLQPKLSDLTSRVQRLWGQVTPERIQSLPPKYQFAMGSSLGMIASPLLVTMTASLWQPALLLYGLAEVNANIKSRGKGSLGMMFGNGENNSGLGADLDSLLERLRRGVRRGGNGSLGRMVGNGGETNGGRLGATLDSLLERLRRGVRHCFPEPESLSNNALLLLETSGGDAKTGYSLGMTGCYAAEPRKRRLPQRLKDFFGSNFMGRALVETKAVVVVEVQETTERHPVAEMIRHGFLFGSAVGLFAGI
jgi:hypothetical protein